ncbi:HDIG domain-containing protein [Saccharibacillus sp. CPCC 101409]|uniref:HD family phosphohydrolase n=1 Tax=Saccharibacillus sp. CPCC 101409 TaxID=3058041 RepID=UPI002672A9B6|nr:HDIG domain-containing metalloprotein [Saccharibacillus sp. CPCC 101409]MDO3409171.1 HDIG domain-containing protein [Saccharibacillus sp. CPCC 101409]
MTSKEKRKRKADPKLAGWKNSRAVKMALFALLTLMFYVALAPKLLPEKYDIQVNMPSDKEILAPTQIPNSKATLQAQEEAAEKVQQVYRIVSMRNDTLVSQLLDRIDTLNQDDQLTEGNKVEIYKEELPQRVDQFVANFIRGSSTGTTYSATLLQEVRARLDEQKYDIPEETFYKIPSLTSAQIQAMKPVAIEIVSRLMNDQITDAQTARARVAEFISRSSLTDRTSREVVQELIRLSITANRFYDEEATKEAAVQARENTETVYIEQGDVLIHRGETITQDMYNLLRENDMLKTEVNYWPQFGLLLLSGLLSMGMLLFTRQNGDTFQYGNPQLLMIVLIYFIMLIAMHLTALVQRDTMNYVGYLAPVAIGCTLITLLLNIPFAYFSAIVFSVLASVVLNSGPAGIFDFHFGFYTLVVSFAAIFTVHRASQRSTILKAGIMVSLFGAIAVLALSLIGDTSPDRNTLLYSVGFALAAGLLTAILAIGLMPFFEVTFGILSALKLVELSNPNHPLLRKLLIETPGTYHHSVMVGNLSEAAAEAIGANGLLCRVGSYYHDIGKTKRPSYFIENQTNIENPHDSIDPKLSKSIIIAHARDGVEMQKEYKLPKRIRDIAEQHHGTTFLYFFYQKALKQAEERGVEPDFTEAEFRYHGPKAQTKEAAVVGIADSVEAAVRSLHKPTIEQVESMIGKIIKSRLDDQQFNECDITLKELDVVAKTLKEAVMGIFHSRIEYPEEEKPKAKEN